jgi:hypothetical protein
VGKIQFRCHGCANTERVNHLIKGGKCDVGQTIGRYGCSQFTPDITASCFACFYNSSLGRISDFTCNKTGMFMTSEREYCPDHYGWEEDDNKKKSGCFITTAVCHILGQPDDCQILNTLRRFRDEKLLTNNYAFLVDDYYSRSGRVFFY